QQRERGDRRRRGRIRRHDAHPRGRDDVFVGDRARDAQPRDQHRQIDDARECDEQRRRQFLGRGHGSILARETTNRPSEDEAVRGRDYAEAAGPSAITRSYSSRASLFCTVIFAPRREAQPPNQMVTSRAMMKAMRPIGANAVAVSRSKPCSPVIFQNGASKNTPPRKPAYVSKATNRPSTTHDHQRARFTNTPSSQNASQKARTETQYGPF